MLDSNGVEDLNQGPPDFKCSVAKPLDHAASPQSGLFCPFCSSSPWFYFYALNLCIAKTVIIQLI